MRGCLTPRAVDVRASLLIFAAALVVRVGVTLVHAPAGDGDQRPYRMLAKSIASGTANFYRIGGAHETAVHPLLPILDATALWVFPNERLAGLVVTMFIGSLLPAVAARVIGTNFG